MKLSDLLLLVPLRPRARRRQRADRVRDRLAAVREREAATEQARARLREEGQL